MTGKSHVAFNAASAIVVNSTLHLVGGTFSWPRFLLLFQDHFVGITFAAPFLTNRLIYYLLVIFGALLPDIDHPASTFGRRCGLFSRGINYCFGHRTLTHSLLGLLLAFIVFFGAGDALLLACAAHGIVVTLAVKQALQLALLSLLLGCMLHILADSLTKSGVPLFWPSAVRYGLLPSPALRFRVDTWMEYVVLWTVILLVGIGVGTGIFGL